MSRRDFPASSARWRSARGQWALASRVAWRENRAAYPQGVVSRDPDAIDSEFVCILRPITRATTPDGGPLRHRVPHAARRWAACERPVPAQRIIEGDPKLSV